MIKKLRNTKERARMDKKTIRRIPFTGEKENWLIWSGKFVVRAGIKVYHILLPGDKKCQLTTKRKYKKNKLLNLSYSTSQLLMS